MRRPTHSLLLVLLLSGGCGTSAMDAPTSAVVTPSSTTRSCRTYATTSVEVTDYRNLGAGYRGRSDNTCQFAGTTLTCSSIEVRTYLPTMTELQPVASQTVTEYASLADFVREASVLPPLTLALRTTSSLVEFGRIARTTSSWERRFDSQGRLVGEAFRSGPSGEDFTYSSWDGAGRVLSGTSAPLSGRASTHAYSYDEQARRSTHRIDPPGTEYHRTFDEHGTLTSYDPETGITNVTVTSTSRICL